MRIGLFGGTFDPVHSGHLDVARAAREALPLDEVWFVPARHPPHRAEPAVSAAHRFAMLALATSGEHGLLVSDLEMDVSGPSYTIDTLDRIEAQRPHLAGSLFFITGSDAFRDIRTWRSYRALLDRCHFVVVSRPGLPASAMRADLPEFSARMIDTPCAMPSAPSIVLVESKTTAVSSTDVRRALAAGQTSVGLVPEPVASYAARHGLYRARGQRENAQE
jgi:nicotinate-nucleotide adenylyltransferase